MSPSQTVKVPSENRNDSGAVFRNASCTLIRQVLGKGLCVPVPVVQGGNIVQPVPRVGFAREPWRFPPGIA